MGIALPPPSDCLADWVRATGRHAAHRLSLLERARRILGGEEDAAQDARRDLAERLERWRYQHLAERSGRLTRQDYILAETLDLAANALARRGLRPARGLRAALADASLGGEAVARAAEVLDPRLSLDEVSRRAADLTCRHFVPPGAGRRRMLLYAPLYLSSHCVNHCTYCGFRHPNPIERRHLDTGDAIRQAEILRGRGFRHVLLVGGDFPRLTTTAYYAEIIRVLAVRAVSSAVEIAPQTTAAYAELAAAGACGVTLYQETYHEPLYALYHPRGTKTSYDWRLEGLERAAEAGIRRLGLGILLGLAEPREDLLAMIRHACYLEARFPDRGLAFSLPRIHEAPQGFTPPYGVDDETFVRMYCALRVAMPRAELVLSTREPAPLRNRLAGICITQLSAGSSTVPGGYEEDGARCDAGQQFPVADHRSPAEVADWLRQAGFEPAWRV